MTARSLPEPGPVRRIYDSTASYRRSLRFFGGLFVSAILLAAWFEMRTSSLEAWLVPRLGSRLSYALGPGPSSRIVFPAGGPFDEARGYTRIPGFQRRLEERGFRVAEQARFSRELRRLARLGITPPYRDPAVTGLVVRGAGGAVLYDAREGRRAFGRFEEIPPLVVKLLLFIEDRELGEVAHPSKNPVVDWDRLARAGLLYTGSKLGLPVQAVGASTLATQLEKYRHSPGGRTDSPADKLRQMVAATLKVYREDPDTREERQEIILDYLNTVPLAASPGYGEVHGLAEGLHAWLASDLSAVTRDLASGEPGLSKARALKQVLLLLCAARAPSHYLVQDRPALEVRVLTYLDRLEKEGILDADLAALVRPLPIEFRGGAPERFPGPSGGKTAGKIRSELLDLLGVEDVYALDRLDLEVETTLDDDLQERVTRLFNRLRDPAFVEARGLREDRLLSESDPEGIVYSFLLYERGPEGNLLRARVDSANGSFDPNTGMKLELGSTAKLRTLAHYLEIVAGLHDELSGLARKALRRSALEARDPLTRWVAGTMAAERGIALDALLDRAMERTYPADPRERFYTGSSVHTFQNYNSNDDDKEFSVRQAFARSTNLVFIRLMRDLVRFHEARLSYDARALLEDPRHPQRPRLLEEAADEEARSVLWREFCRYRKLPAEAVVDELLGDRARSPRHLSLVFYAWRPGASEEDLARWLRARSGPISPERVHRLARAHGDPRPDLVDYGALLGRHPLELWCAGELHRDPEVSWSSLLRRSQEARRIVSAWPLRPGHRKAQDDLLRARIERDAFARMAPRWQRLGFPFEKLVPSYATAIGSSADRPAALADLLGIILNDGVRLPERCVQQVRFGAGTPYHTVLEADPAAGERVMPQAVARLLRASLVQVVGAGTARRISGVFALRDGTTVEVGGKTGSGDNRFEILDPRGQLVSSRPVSRTASFVFFIGDRYYGVVTAFAVGPESGDHRFTSSLPIAVLGLLAPSINEQLSDS